MKVLIVAFVLVAAPTFAQSMPDRGAEVAELVKAKYAGMLNGDDTRRREVLDLLCGDLNLIDAGQWARLIKNDRNPPGLPADTLVWKLTREHVDALADFGPAWIERGVLPSPDWSPLPCATAAPPPVPVPPTEPPAPVGDVLAEVRAVKTIAEQARELAGLARDFAASADKEIKEHRDGVKREYYKWFAILGNAFGVIMTILKLRGGGE